MRGSETGGGGGGVGGGGDAAVGDGEVGWFLEVGH